MSKVLGIYTSNGGVPKHPVSSADVDELGLISDKQNNRKHHGGVNKAVCVLDNNLLIKLRNEGHPIYAGSTGENLLLEGFDLDIGKVIDLGDVILEVVSAASPCYKIAGSFTVVILTECHIRNIQRIQDGTAKYCNPEKSEYPIELIVCQFFECSNRWIIP